MPKIIFTPEDAKKFSLLVNYSYDNCSGYPCDGVHYADLCHLLTEIAHGKTVEIDEEEYA